MIYFLLLESLYFNYSYYIQPMKTFIKFLCSRLLLFASLPTILLLSCTKSDSSEQAPIINDISPIHGAGNSTLKIRGLHFSYNVGNVFVKINGITAAVTSVSDSVVLVTVPLGAGTGNVSMTLNGFNVTGPIFKYDYVTTVSTVTGKNNSALFNYPVGVAIDKQNNIYVAELGSSRISKISAAGDVSILAGAGTEGFADGTGQEARFNYPWAVEVDSSGNVYVADLYNHRIRKISAGGQVTTIAGIGTPGYADGAGATAQFNYPDGITVDKKGNIYVSDRNNYAVRIITAAGMVSSLYPDRSTAPFSGPHGLLINDQGEIYVADFTSGYSRIMRTNINNIQAWKQFGRGDVGYLDGQSAFAYFNGPSDVVADNEGNIYIADAGNHRVRKLSPDGIVSTVAGNGNNGIVDGPASDAEFTYLNGIAIDTNGNLYVADSGSGTIRKISTQ